MRSRFARAVVMALVLNAAAGVALAGLLSPFGFSFFTPALNSWFLLPFALSGCG